MAQAPSEAAESPQKRRPTFASDLEERSPEKGSEGDEGERAEGPDRIFSPRLGMPAPMRFDIRRLTEQSEALSTDDEGMRFHHFLAVKGPPIFIVAVMLPAFMRTFDLEPQARCGFIMLGVLTLSLFELMPLFCVALFIPVLGSICAVFGEDRTMLTTSRLLLGSFFNQTSFLVLGSLVINAVFEKCGLLDVLTSSLLRRWRMESKSFLLVIMLSTMAACSVLVSGSIVVLAALKPLLMKRGPGQLEVPVIKRLLLGVAFAANAGSILLPISSPVTLITVSLLRDFACASGIGSWFFISAPVVPRQISRRPHFNTTYCARLPLARENTKAVPATVVPGTKQSWWVLCYFYPAEHDDEEAVIKTVEEGLEESPEPTLSRQVSLSHASEVQMTQGHWFMLASSCLAVLGMTIFAEAESSGFAVSTCAPLRCQALEPVLGHPAILALAVVVLAFGSGFLSRDEFLCLEWDLLAIVGGTNVMALMVRETALAAKGSAIMTQMGLIGGLSFWPFTALVISTLIVFGTFCGHQLAGVIALPLLVALGVKLKAAELFAMLCALAIPLGMGMPSCSFDNMAAQSLSRSLKRKGSELFVRDYLLSGSATAVCGAMLTLTLGFGVRDSAEAALVGCSFCLAFQIGCLQHGFPKPPSEVRHERTPEELEPQVVKENRVLDLKAVTSKKLDRKEAPSPVGFTGMMSPLFSVLALLSLPHLGLATRPLEDLTHALDRSLDFGNSSTHSAQRSVGAMAMNGSESHQSGNRSNNGHRGHPVAAASKPSSLAQAEYELETERRGASARLEDDGGPRQSKVMLIFVVFLGLGFCGLDHCLVGNFILGTLKLLTVGGFGFWFLLDWMLIVFNCVNQYSTLSGFGWDVVFTPCSLPATPGQRSIEDACRIGQVTCLLHAPFVFALLKAKLQGRSVQSSVQQPAQSTVAFLRQKGIVSESPASWEIDHVFEASDKNRDGFVTAQELKEGLASLGCEISDQQLAELMGGQQTLRRAELAQLLAKKQDLVTRRPSKHVASSSDEGVSTAPQDDTAKADG
ncbi:PHO91 [Symbiodinium sp. CCMP2456]|nr:PHO91 [Symbiodinium sp. CCMP2456]